MTEFDKWLDYTELSDTEREELLSIQDNFEEIEDRFFAPLSFGTAGLRGKIGMGINRMNIYTVAQATRGLANLILSEPGAAERGVVIAMDTRNKSDLFARVAAEVLAYENIRVYLFDAPRPTPELSFAVLHLGAAYGINITASHNPKEYNGYKVYAGDGAQLPPEAASVVAASILETDIFEGAPRMDLEIAITKEIVTMIGSEIDEEFLKNVLAMAKNKSVSYENFSLVYTPFHGTGIKLVPEALRRLGVKHIFPVPEQMIPDGNFPTVKSPNPENFASFELAIKLAKEKNIDFIIGTDPDTDRIGAVSRKKDGEYYPISGNQMGVLLLDYLSKTLTLPPKPAFISTIVSTKMTSKIAESYGVSEFRTLTGFKFIAQKIAEIKEEGYEYILSFEESYGYLMGEFCRDKDAVTAAVIISEMAAFYKEKNQTLFDALEELYRKFGYFIDHTIDLVMEGVSGLAKIKELMASLREHPPEEFAGVRVTGFRDINPGNVIELTLADETTILIRPSGTEPKVKVYILASDKTYDTCLRKVETYKEAALKFKEME